MNAQALFRRFLALTPRTRHLAIACVVLGFGILSFACVLARDTRVSLFAAPLLPDQVAEVEERLAAWNVPAIVTADAIRIDANKRSDLLLRLAVAGVPHAHVASSSEQLGKAGALTPQSVLAAQEREGLAGDLALALRGIAGVSDARVIVAPARAGTYADERDAPATASVRLVLAPGAHIEPARVAAIATFVANAVPGLAAEHVAILDDRGEALDARETAPGGAEVQAALQSAIDAAFGTGAAIVRVRVDRDERSTSVHETRRQPLGTGTIARESSDERFASEKRRYAKTTATEDRGSLIRDERVEGAAGRVARISVAVVVDAARRVDLRAVRALADATAGIDRKRGDVVSVLAVPFGRSAAPVLGAGPWWLAFAGSAPQLLALVAVLAVLVLGGRPAARAFVRIVERAEMRAATKAVAGAPPDRVRVALAGEPPHTAAAIISALPAATATAVLDLYPPDERAAIVRRLSRERNPLLEDVDPIAYVASRHG